MSYNRKDGSDMISLIACVGKNGELGKGNQLCFHIEEDMAFFKRKTRNKVVLMGRRTYESIGGPLKNRINCVATRDPVSLPGNAIPCVSVPTFLENYRDDIFVIGGASIYAQALPHADVIYLTEVDESADADAFFPKFDKSLYRRKVLKTGENFKIVEYRRKNVYN